MATQKQLAKLRELLITVAKNRSAVAYSDIDKISGLDVKNRPADRWTLSEILGKMGEDEVAASFSWLLWSSRAGAAARNLGEVFTRQRASTVQSIRTSIQMMKFTRRPYTTSGRGPSVKIFESQKS